MSRALEVYRFELGYQLRRTSTLLYVLIVTGMGVMFMKMMSDGPTLDGTWFNSPFAVMMVTGAGSMLALMLIPGVAGDAASRDIDCRMHSLFYTSPVGRSAYLTGRLLGAITLSALLMLGLPVGALLATSMPWVEAGNLAPFRASTYLRPYLLLALPNGLVAAAVLFGVAVLTRRAIASYAGAAFLVFLSIICGKTLAPKLGWDAAKLLDPLGYTTVLEILQSTNAMQKNAFVLTLDGPLLANRLLWLAAGVTVLGAAYARFRFAHEGIGGERARSRSEDAGPRRIEATRIAVPVARRVFDASTRMRQLLAIAMRSFHELHTSRVWWIVPLVALGFIQAAPQLATTELGVPTRLTTARLLTFLTGDVSLFLTLLIALSAGELVWRERSARIHSLADVTPRPDWVSVAGKFLGLAMMLVATMCVFMLAGVAAQAMAGVDRYDPDLYVTILFGLHLPEYLLTAALAMIVHVVVNQKYVANVLVVLWLFARDAIRGLGIEDSLFLYGDLPVWNYSEISGFGPQTEARIWFTLYYAGWALLFVLATYLLWVRGEEHRVRQRLALARGRLTGATAAVGGVAVVIIAATGGFIFYDTHVVHDLQTSAEIEQRSAEFERRYGRYASLPQPSLAATKLRVDFYPQRRTATVRGIHRLENRTDATIDSIHVATGGAESTAVTFDRASRPLVMDDEHGYRIYALDQPLAPGEEVQMHFGVSIRSSAFAKQGTPPVVENGSLLIQRPRDGDHWLPVVGYQPVRELDNGALRKKYGLRERSPYPKLGDEPVGIEQKGYEKIDFEAIIGTDGDQLGVAPGEMRRMWTDNERRYVHYIADAPISNAYTILSANYAVHRDTWRPSAGGEPVAIEIVHHPSHTENLERMAHGVRASLEYHTREFGPYPYRQVRLVEYPTPPSVIGMTAHSGLITYAEGVSFMRPEDDPRRIDFPFAVVAHEMAHQWWGHQIVPALVEGAPFLGESLSWYSAMLVVEETLGRDHLQRLLAVMRAHYLGPNQPRAFPLLRTVSHLDAYRTGPLAMYALREAVGVEPVNRALRNLLAKFPPDREPYPTTLDFYGELRAAIPSSAHGLLNDLLAEITFWDLRLTGMKVEPAGEGRYRVTLQIEAEKLKGDGTGSEQAVPMDDAVEIALFDADGAPVYQATHSVRSGRQMIELVVPRTPVRAVIDPEHELLDRRPEDNEIIVRPSAR